jgi:glutaredoxin 3
MQACRMQHLPVATALPETGGTRQQALSGLCHHGFKRISTGITMAQPQIDIYTKFACPFCVRAKRLLTEKGAAFTEYDITMGGEKRDEMLARAPNAMTVPQIFIGETYVGGSDDLAALEREGKLDDLLAG